MLQPPLPLHSFFPAHELDSGTAQPPLPLHSLRPMQQAFAAPPAWAIAAGAAAAGAGVGAGFSLHAPSNAKAAAEAMRTRKVEEVSLVEAAMVAEP